MYQGLKDVWVSTSKTKNLYTIYTHVSRISWCQRRKQRPCMQSIHMYQGYIGVNVENKEFIYNLYTCIKDILVSTSKTKNSNHQPLCVKHLPYTVMFITPQKDLTKIQLNYVNSHRYLMTIIAVFHLRGDFKDFQRMRGFGCHLV